MEKGSICLELMGNWNIPNPANPEDNLADRWNKDSKIPYYFFPLAQSSKKRFN